MTKAELDQLRQFWHEAVVFGEVEDPDHPLEQVTVQPCWFAGGEYGPCDPVDSRIREGAHWIKRQTVEKWVRGQLPEHLDLAVPAEPGLRVGGLVDFSDWRLAIDDLPLLAAWDPRNGVCACERHHRIFDSQRVPLPSEQIVVWRHQVPAHVEAFALDWGLEHELDRKHQPRPQLGAAAPEGAVR